MADGLWVSENRFVEFSSGQLKYPQGVAGSRYRTGSSLYGAFNQFFKSLPNPDIVLKKLGRGVEVYEDLKIDGHVSSCIQSRQAAILGQKWSINRNREDTPESKFIQDVFERIDVYTIAEHLLEAPFFGAAYMEILWRLEGSFVYPAEVKDRAVEHFSYDAVGLPRLRTVDSNDGELLQPQKWLISKHKPKYKNPYGEAILSKCWYPVLFKKNNWKFWLRLSEKYGMPHLVGKLDYAQAEENTEDDLFSALEELSQDGITVIPEHAEIELLEAVSSTRSAELYSGLMTYSDTQITKAILSHADATDSVAGKLGGDHTAMSVRDDVVQADQRMVEKTINTFIRYICKINFNSTTFPKFEFYKENQVDMVRAERDKILSDTGMIRFTKSYFIRNYDVKEDEIEIVEKQPVTHPDAQPTPPESSTAQHSCGDAYGEIGPAHGLAVTHASDALAGSDESLRVMDALIQPVVKMIQDGSEYEEVVSSLHKMFGKLDTAQMETIIRRALIVADTVGRISARQDQGIGE